MTADVTVARNLMYAVERAIDVGAMTRARMLPARGAGRRRGRSWRRAHRHGRRHHHDRSSAVGASCTATASRSAATTSRSISRGLNARIADAERIKTLYGSLPPASTCDMITIPAAEREAPARLARCSRASSSRASRKCSK
jgi:hypothetical protein